MITYFEGTVFNAPVKTFVNTVNCAGVMGAGIALEFKLRYPEMYIEYVEKCKNKKIVLGKPSIYEYSDNLWIMNFPTKGNWRFPSKIQWIDQGLKYFAENYKKRNIESIAFPKLGTNNGGLSWDEVKVLMEKYLSNLDINIYICLDEKQEAEGVERVMLESLNSLTVEKLISEVKVPKKQAEKIYCNIPYNRFWYVSELEGIGEKTYEKLFNYFYEKKDSLHEIEKNNKNDNNIIEYEQLTFF